MCIRDRQIPGLVKIVVNMGVGEAARDSKVIDGAVRDLTAITGQKPVVTKARKSIAQFKLREGMPIGCHVTLRGDRMWEFADRLLTLALPRIRDFRGLSARQFDGKGNYTFGLTEQVMFHEIDQDKIDRLRGMDITFVTSATNDDAVSYTHLDVYKRQHGRLREVRKDIARVYTCLLYTSRCV